MKKFIITLLFSLIVSTEAFADLTFNQEKVVTTQTDQIRGINFKPDGTIMYVTERNGATDNNIGRAANIIQYSLTTPFDISTATETSNTRVEEEDGVNLAFLPHAIEFKPDGTRLFIIANSGTLVYQFDLSTPWDTSTITFSAKYNVTGESQLRTLTFKPDGKRMYVSGKQNHKLKEYILTNAWDITSSNVSVGAVSASLESADNNMRNVQFNSLGTELYVGGNQNNNMNKFTLSSAWDISTISSSFTAYSLSGDHSNMRGFIFAQKFSRLYVTDDIDGGANRVIEYVASCSFTVNCEDASKDTNVVALLEAQVELSKRIIRHNTLPIIHRIEWLRRHKNYDNLNNFQAEISFTNQRLSKLLDNIKPNAKRKKIKSDDDKWFKWNEGKIGVGKTNEKTGSLARNIHTTGFVIGADKKKNKDTMYGYAFQFGTDNVDLKTSSSGIFAKSYSLSMYGTKLRENHIFSDGLIGISRIDLDLEREENTNILEGKRKGEQIFSTLNIGKRINTENLNFNPNIKFDLGYTRLHEFKETNGFGTTTDVLLFKQHEILTGLGTASMIVDKTIKHYKDRIINHSGRLEYVVDFSPDSDANFYYVNDPSTEFSKNIDLDTEHNIRVGYGFDVISITGWSFIGNFERFFTIDNGYINEIYLSAGYTPTESIDYAMSIENNQVVLNYKRAFSGIDVKMSTNYNMLSHIPEYGATINVVSKF